jgi:hypothetical protein
MEEKLLQSEAQAKKMLAFSMESILGMRGVDLRTSPQKDAAEEAEEDEDDLSIRSRSVSPDSAVSSARSSCGSPSHASVSMASAASALGSSPFNLAAYTQAWAAAAAVAAAQAASISNPMANRPPMMMGRPMQPGNKKNFFKY